MPNISVLLHHRSLNWQAANYSRMPFLMVKQWAAVLLQCATPQNGEAGSYFNDVMLIRWKQKGYVIASWSKCPSCAAGRRIDHIIAADDCLNRLVRWNIRPAAVLAEMRQS